MTRFPQAQVISLARLQCTDCGAEANASCNCGKPYVPAKMRVAEYDKANPGKSTREAAADLGISKSMVSKSRDEVSTSGHVTGRDGKEYPAKKIKNDEPPDEETSDAEHEQGLRVNAVRGFLYRANEASGLADLGRLKSEDVTDEMIEKAESATAAWNTVTRKLRSQKDPHIIEEPCDDCDKPEDFWQRSLSNLAGDAISMEAHWSKQFGQ